MYDLESPEIAQQSEVGCQKIWGNVCPSGFCKNGECYSNELHEPQIPMCQCKPGFFGKNCDQEAQWVEFKGASSFLKFTTPISFDNSRDLETLFVLPQNYRNPAQVAAVLGGNNDVCFLK